MVEEFLLDLKLDTQLVDFNFSHLYVRIKRNNEIYKKGT